MIPDFLKKLLGGGRDAAGSVTKSLPVEPAMDLGITPKPTIASPLSPSYANPLDTMAATPAPDPGIPSLVNNPRMAGKTIQDEYNLRQSDPNQEVVFREPFGADKYDYVTQGGTELPKRSWKEALKNIATGAMVGMGNGGGLGGALGGAVTGGVTGAINPTMGKQMRFNSLQLPKLVQDQQYRQDQAMGQAKIGAENAKAQREGIFNVDGSLIDANRGRVLYESPEEGVNVDGSLVGKRSGKVLRPGVPKPSIIPAGAIAQFPDGKQVSNPRPATPTPRAWKQDAEGNYVDLNAAENQGKTIQGPSKSQDLTPQQTLQFQRQERADATKMAMEAEGLKADANKALRDGDQGSFQTFRGQHTAAAKWLAQTYPDYFDVTIDKDGWAQIKATGAGKRQLPTSGKAGKGMAAGGTISKTTAMDLLNR